MADFNSDLAFMHQTTSKLQKCDNIYKERSQFTTIYLIELARQASAQTVLAWGATPAGK